MSKGLAMGGVLAAGVLVWAATGMPQSAGQEPAASLGEYARTLRAEPHPKAPASRRFHNDNLPTDTVISVVGEEPRAASAAADETPQPPEPQTQNDLSARQTAYAEWQKKVADGKQQIDLLTRELEVLQREFNLRAAEFYGDAASRLRSPGLWDKQGAEFQQKIAEKQQALSAARTKLDELQEGARKAGVPAAMRE